jgi:hypothetical protein
MDRSGTATDGSYVVLKKLLIRASVLTAQKAGTTAWPFEKVGAQRSAHPLKYSRLHLLYPHGFFGKLATFPHLHL